MRADGSPRAACGAVHSLHPRRPPAARRPATPHPEPAGPALVLAADFVNSPYRELIWLAAVAVSGPLVAGVEGFQVMPAYFVERHGSMIIIALGEAIVQIGVGAGADLGGPPVLAGAVLGVLICAALWWTYFGSAHHRRFDGYRRRARRAGGKLVSGNR